MLLFAAPDPARDLLLRRQTSQFIIPHVRLRLDIGQKLNLKRRTEDCHPEDNLLLGKGSPSTPLPTAAKRYPSSGKAAQRAYWLFVVAIRWQFCYTISFRASTVLERAAVRFRMVNQKSFSPELIHRMRIARTTSTPDFLIRVSRVSVDCSHMVFRNNLVLAHKNFMVRSSDDELDRM